jgi:hypothetical protein
MSIDNSANTNEYDIFLSYRRNGGETMAILLRDRLAAMGYSVFLDIEGLNAGAFNTALLGVIEKCKDVIVVCSENSLDRCVNEGDWVRIEIAHAFRHNKNVVPLLLRGFVFPDNLPADIAALSFQNGVTADRNEYFDAAIERLATKFLTSKPVNAVKPRSKKKWIFAGAGAAALVIAAVGIIWAVSNNDTAPARNNEPRQRTSNAEDTGITPQSSESDEIHVLHLPNGDVYEGELKDGLYNGQGTMTYANGDVYEGEWKNGERNGHGKMTYANGDIYEGELKDGILNGQGTYTFADGRVYTGEFERNMRHGQGIMTWTDGQVYMGELKDDKRHGQGTTTYASGDVYEGEWENDVYSGHGTYTWANGVQIYTGEWKDGKYNGQGTMTFVNGNVYEGTWSDDQRNGQGTMTYADGSVYEGEWENDIRHGQGTMWYADGRVSAGKWVDGNHILGPLGLEDLIRPSIFG